MSTSKPRRRGGRRGEEQEEHEGNLERWLLTYADMITLLMVLFIVLFAISVVDKKKFAALADGLSHQFGATNKVLPAGTGVIDGGRTSNNDQGQLANNPAQPLSPIDQVEVSKQRQQQIQKENLLKQEQQTLLNAKQQIEAALKAKGLQNSASFKLTSRGLVVSIVTDQVLFDTGKSDLKPVGQQVLDAVAPALLKLPNDISIEGHTDNVPITGGVFASNWELSAVRATTVLRYLMAHDGLQADRMSATGYADTKPVVPNDSAAHQAQNRRVELVVLSTLLNDSTDSTDSTNAINSTNVTAGPNTAAVIPAGGSG